MVECQECRKEGKEIPKRWNELVCRRKGGTNNVELRKIQRVRLGVRKLGKLGIGGVKVLRIQGDFGKGDVDAWRVQRKQRFKGHRGGGKKPGKVKKIIGKIREFFQGDYFQQKGSSPLIKERKKRCWRREKRGGGRVQCAIPAPFD